MSNFQPLHVRKAILVILKYEFLMFFCLCVWVFEKLEVLLLILSNLDFQLLQAFINVFEMCLVSLFRAAGRHGSVRSFTWFYALAFHVSGQVFGQTYNAFMQFCRFSQRSILWNFTEFVDFLSLFIVFKNDIASLLCISWLFDARFRRLRDSLACFTFMYRIHFLDGVWIGWRLGRFHLFHFFLDNADELLRWFTFPILDHRKGLELVESLKKCVVIMS